MTFFNPLSGALVPGTSVQRAATDKERQIARSQALRKNAAADAERVEHQVESTEGLTAASGDHPSGGRGGERQRRGEEPPGGDDSSGADDQPPHIDIKA